MLSPMRNAFCKAGLVLGMLVAIGTQSFAQNFQWYHPEAPANSVNVIPWSDFSPRFLDVPEAIESGTRTNDIVIDVRNVPDITVWIVGSLAHTNTGTTLVLPYVTSPDGTNWNQSAIGSASLTWSGVNTVMSSTNINVSNIGWLKFTDVIVGATNTTTAGLKVAVTYKPDPVRNRSR